jgi:hypothetical protein
MIVFPPACGGPIISVQMQIARERYRRRCKMSSWVPVLFIALMWCFIPRVPQSLAAEAKVVLRYKETPPFPEMDEGACHSHVHY